MNQTYSVPLLFRRPSHKILVLILLSAIVAVAAAAPAYALPYPGSSGLPQLPNSQRSFETWLKATGKPVASRYKGYPASYETWRDYNLLVYGIPKQVPGNRYDAKTGQYVSLGYSYDERVVTNSMFPDDSPDGRTYSTPWQWVEHKLGTAAKISWARLDARQKALIRQSALFYRGRSYGGMTFKALGLSEQKTIVLAQPSWGMGFALYTTHDLPGRPGHVRYATFTGTGAGGADLSVSIEIENETKDGSIVLGRDRDYVDISYSISGRIVRLTGLARLSDIRYCGAGSGDQWTQGRGRGPWTATIVRRISREDLKGEQEKSFSLEGSAWLVTAMGDIQIEKTARSVTVRAEEPLPPFNAVVSVRGEIGYFAGQTNAFGRILDFNPKRFLGMEKMLITIDFNRPPESIRYSFGNRNRNIVARAGKTHYVAEFDVPMGLETIDWNNFRIQTARDLVIRAKDQSDPAETLEVVVSGLDITGCVYDITHAQLIR